jgi:hypothetical protein
VSGRTGEVHYTGYPEKRFGNCYAVKRREQGADHQDEAQDDQDPDDGEVNDVLPGLVDSRTKNLPLVAQKYQEQDGRGQQDAR